MRAFSRSMLPSVKRPIRTAALVIVAAAAAARCGGPGEPSSTAATDAVASSPPSPPPEMAMAGKGMGVSGDGASSPVMNAPPPQARALQEQFAAVAQSRADAPAQRDAAQPVAPPMPSSVTTSTQPSSSSMVIRSGTASVQVDSLEVAIGALRASSSAFGGFIGNTWITTGEDQVRRASIEIKLPAAQYDAAIAGLTPLGKVESVNSTAQDVGEEFVDLTARVANARRLEARLIALLDTRTGRLQDALAVERELSRVREEIERIEGRARYLSSRAAVSTLTVFLHEPFPIVSAHHGQNVLAEAFKDAWRNFVRVIAALISSLGVLIPVGVIAGAAALAWRRRVRTPLVSTTVSSASK
jgi:hypothetical protein